MHSISLIIIIIGIECLLNSARGFHHKSRVIQNFGCNCLFNFAIQEELNLGLHYLNMSNYMFHDSAADMKDLGQTFRSFWHEQIEIAHIFRKYVIKRGGFVETRDQYIKNDRHDYFTNQTTIVHRAISFEKDLNQKILELNQCSTNKENEMMCRMNSKIYKQMPLSPKIDPHIVVFLHSIMRKKTTRIKYLADLLETIDKSINPNINNKFGFEFKYSKNVIHIDETVFPVFKCPIASSNQSEIDPSILIYRNHYVKNLSNKENPIFLSNKNANLMHRVKATRKINNFTFAYASMASLNELFDELKLPKQRASFIKETLFDEKIPSDLLIQDLNNNRAFKVNNIYKCSGKNDFFLVKASKETESLRINDKIYNDKSNGYLETITSIDRLDIENDQKRILIETELTDCSRLVDSFESRINNLDLINMKNIDLSCKNSFNSKKSIYVLEENQYDYIDFIGKIIAGRKSTKFASQIVSIKTAGKYLLLEGISLMQNDPTANSLLKDSYTFPFHKSIPDSGLISLLQIVSFNMSLDIFTNISLWADISYSSGLNEIGIELDADINFSSRFYLKLSPFNNSFSMPLLDSIELCTFEVPIHGIPVPGSIFASLDTIIGAYFKVQPDVEVGMEWNKTVKIKIPFIYRKEGENSFPDSNSIEDIPSTLEFKDIDLSNQEIQPTFSLKTTLIPELKVSWPNIGEFDTSDKNIQKCPEYLLYLVKKLITALQISTSISIPISGEFTARACDLKSCPNSNELALAIEGCIDEIDFGFDIVIFGESLCENLNEKNLYAANSLKCTKKIPTNICKKSKSNCVHLPLGIDCGEQCRVLENKNKYDKNNSNIYCDLGKACNFTCNPGYTESTLKPFCLPKMPPAWEIEPKCTSQKCGDKLSNYRKFPINVKLDTSSSNGNFEIDQEYELSIYFVSFDTKLRMPQYSIALQDKKQKITNCKRKNYFYKHPCNEIQITTGDFNNTGYNRGHLTPNEAMCFSQKAANATFLIINVAAQDPDTNQQSWKDLEKKVSDFSETYSSIVVTGVCSDVKKIINTKNNVLNVPECFWKMICFQLEFNGVYHTIVFGVSAENSIGATQKERNDQLKIILPQSEIIKKNSNIKKELIWDESKILILSQTKVLAPSLKKQITLPDPDRCKTSNLKDLDASLLNYLNDKILNTFTK